MACPPEDRLRVTAIAAAARKKDNIKSPVWQGMKRGERTRKVEMMEKYNKRTAPVNVRGGFSP